MLIQVYPRIYFKEIAGTSEEQELFEHFNVISIITPAYAPKGFEAEDVPFSQCYKNSSSVCVLNFHDASLQSNNEIVLFNEHDAETIWNFVQSTKDNGKIGYVVHCTAGLSRSQAVGYVLNEYFNGRYGINYNEHEYQCYERKYQNARRMNSLVKSLLMKRFFS